MTRTTAQPVTAHATNTGHAVLLQATDLHKSFGATEALRGASMSLGSGEIVAVMGPSGSGKSTLLHCMAGIVAPDKGTVHLDGTDVGAMTDGERTALRRGEFGFVFQFGQLVPELPCVENVAMPLRLDGVPRRKAEQIAVQAMAKLDVDDLARKLPGEISGGEGQRVAVARALVTEPRVIFADEPTGALDSLNGEKVMTQLVDAARQAGAAIVLVTHDPKVAAYSDREVIVRDGRTREIGGPGGA